MARPAERCANESLVVTAEEVATILESLGTIEPSPSYAAGPAFEAGAAPGFAPAGGATAVAAAIEDRPRRLYRLPDERKVAGVAAGVAAWMRWDDPIVRAAWVLVPIFMLGITHGSSIPMAVGLYAILAFVLPRATSPEAKAAAHGYGTTAQDLLMHARSGVEPAMSEVGTRLGALIRVLMHVARILLLIAITALLVMWVVSAAWLAIAGEPMRSVFGPDFSTWLAPLFITCIAVVCIAPLTAVVVIIDYGLRTTAAAASAIQQRSSHLTLWLLGSTAAWFAAVTIAVLVVSTIPGMRDLWATGESRIYFRGTTYCFVADSTSDHCRPGDEIVRDDPPPVRDRRGVPGVIGPDGRTDCMELRPGTVRCETFPAIPGLPGIPGASGAVLTPAPTAPPPPVDATEVPAPAR